MIRHIWALSKHKDDKQIIKQVATENDYKLKIGIRFLQDKYVFNKSSWAISSYESG